MQNAISLLDLHGTQVYQFENKVPTLLKGPHTRQEEWRMTQCKYGQAVIVNKDSSIQVHLRKQITMITYDDTKAYFSKLQNGYACLHFARNNDNIDVFEYKLQQNDISLFQWNQAKQGIKKEIKKSCGSKIDKEKCTEIGNVQKVGMTVGNFFGSINKMVKGVPSEKVGEGVSQKVEKIKEKHVSEDSKSKWKSLKEKLNSVNKSVADSIKPAGQRFSDVTTGVGQSFQNSDNTVVKGIREFGNKLKTSLNKGFSSNVDGKQEPKVEILMDRPEQKKQQEQGKNAEREEEVKVETKQQARDGQQEIEIESQRAMN